MLKLRDIMTEEVLAVSPDTTLRQALELFARHQITGAPVVDGRKVVGVVSATDVLSFVGMRSSDSGSAATVEEDMGTPWADSEGSGEIDSMDLADMEEESSAAYYTQMWSETEDEVMSGLEPDDSGTADLLSVHTVEEVMTREVVSLPPNTAVTAAADYMQRARVHRVLVISRKMLEGIVTTMDITKAVAEHKLTSRSYVFTDGSRFPAERAQWAERRK